MSKVIFYEKPGCINNTKQKKWLRLAGHEVEEHSILTHSWTKDELKKFFAGKQIADCFNTTAPVIKSGELDYAALSEDESLAMMVETPILIKRPLIIAEGEYIQGFDKAYLNKLIGLSAEPGNEDEVGELDADNLTRCPNLDKQNDCDKNDNNS